MVHRAVWQGYLTQLLAISRCYKIYVQLYNYMLYLYHPIIYLNFAPIRIPIN